MSDKYGFGGGITLPLKTPQSEPRKKVDDSLLGEAVRAGADLGYINREPTTRLKPGRKRKEPQGQVTIPGPKRVVDELRSFCLAHDFTLWEGVEFLLKEQKRKSG